ncbi:proteasome assembly chaperone family protein [Halopenitus persicus]|uniref:proteasome assembly chaperone family protein n=1 Tax=Halopenitus persicus TaxID=1048396 RepID=UPI000BBAEA06|nr:PAC2 family protein [Halopenitus persicus]
MARINVLAEDVELDAPFLVEGLPGVGLVGKIAADHIVEAFDMVHYANVHCDGVPPVVTYPENDSRLSTPVRIYADADRDLLVLQSDVPVSPAAATEFADCVAGWFDEKGVTPLYLSGRPAEKDTEPPALYGIATGDGAAHLERVGIDAPSEMGLVTGPTGALLSHALENDTTAVGLVVESDPQFPDPEASRALITNGLAPITEVDIPTDTLVDRADEIQRAKEQLAMRMQDVEEESTEARPLRMYQ